MKTEIKYCLYALPVNDESIVFATKHEFARIRANRVLVYRQYDRRSERDVPETAVRLSDGDAAAILDEDELRWLTKCNVTILERVADRYRVPMEEAIPGFLERLKTELEDMRRAKDAEKERSQTE